MSFLPFGADFTQTGEKDVTLAITPEALAASTGEDIKAVAVIAKASNTGVVYIGNGSGQDFPIPKFGEGAPFAFAAKDLSEVFVKVETDGDGVHFAYAIRSHT